MDKKVYVTLENGKVFEGYSFGAEREVVGELVFTTGMTGYIETLTDPSYFGQIVTQTFPLIGNYGMIPEDCESGKCWVSGYIVREKCELTKIVREAGVMPAAITFEPLKDISVLKGYKVKDAVKSVTGHERRESGPEGGRRVVLYDFGAKGNIVKELVKRGCHVIEVPADTTAEEALSLRPDGIMLANGPGDPEENTAVIEEIRKFAGKLPVFGICLGHQLFALAVSTGKVFISSQNHGYEVVSDSLKGVGEVTFVNANDNTCEGVNYPGLRAFTVQFHPEACGGPHDANYLFDEFLAEMSKEAHHA